MSKKIVIIGNGMVGYKFCEKFKAQNNSDSYQLIVFGEEPRPAYNRVNLSNYFKDYSEKNLTLAPRSWYESQDIILHAGALITRIDREAKTVTTHTGETQEYDYLVLATGSSAFVPPIEGIQKQGVFVYRTLEDLDAIIAYGRDLNPKKDKKVAVLGGGLLGLEAAKAVLDMNLEAIVIEFAPRLMPRQLNEEGADVLQTSIESLGIEVLTGHQTKRIGGNEKIAYLQFADDQCLDVQMLIISAGIRPRDELAKQCGLDTGARGGIVVNEKMQTSDPYIYAIGEVALYKEQSYGLVAPGYEMADVAVHQLLGKDKVMPADIDMSTKLKLMGVDVASFGDCFGTTQACRSIEYRNKLEGVYKKIHVSADGKYLLGGMLVGDAQDYHTLLQITQNSMVLPPNPENLILGARGGEGAAMGSVLDFPDSAIICSCENVSKGIITQAILEENCETVKAISKNTNSCTGCGGCKPLVADLLKGVLAAQGKIIKETICEHFPYSRQELYDLIKIKEVKHYNEALDKLGTGDGCEICKPALASIFAGINNETANQQPAIQDTNDRFLANIQRNGTYSVVPRIPGGEITAEKLIVLGQIAQKYDLYTKITGGQRIDLFGARLNDLPFIWEELIEAGFESGHAYGKALRTVKSCVGSTWCRYGMNESVSFAVEIENRYKGIRSPHKLKGGVSGCIRECAEARGKDFGIIATEKGWNLYVCGNGGANPKHAILLAESIDNETCIKYLDRFLMYYIKTAAPLTRTAPWLEKLDGGIDYLKQVIVEDILGIGEELEKEMSMLIENYQCEWKEAIHDPTMRKRFKHFFNTDEEDDNIQFVPLRDQKMPRLWD